jgi:ankyrin repeat protein
MDLHEIARNGTPDEIQSYFERLNANSSDSEQFQEYVRAFINTKNDNKYSPLHCSIFSRSFFASSATSLTFLRNTEIFSYLIDKGCDVNSKCHGSSPLHLLIATAILPNGGEEFGLSCASALISAGCDLLSKVSLSIIFIS